MAHGLCCSNPDPHLRRIFAITPRCARDYPSGMLVERGSQNNARWLNAQWLGAAELGEDSSKF